MIWFNKSPLINKKTYWYLCPFLITGLIFLLIIIKYPSVSIWLAIGGVGIIFYYLPEVSFGLFLIAGFFKADPRLQSILPSFLDLTVFFGAIVGIYILSYILKHKLKIPRIKKRLFLPYILLTLLMFLSLLYTQAPIYGKEKFLRFITITTLAIFAPLFLFRNIKNLHRFFYTLITVSSLMVIDSIISSSRVTGFHTAFGSNYLALGRITGVVVLIIVFYFLLVDKSKRKLFWTIIFLLNAFGLFYGGGRGPVIAFGLTLLLLSIFSSLSLKISKNKKRVLKITFSIFLIIIIIAFISPSAFSTLLGRVKILFIRESGGTSVAKRIDLYKAAINAFLKRPILGLGIGGFSVYYWRIDTRGYPHNILLEIGSELGIFGLISFLFLIGLCFFNLLSLQKKCYKESKKYFLITTILSLFIFMFLNTLVSGDINDNRLFFTWIGIAYALGSVLKFKNSKKVYLSKNYDNN